MHGSAVSLRRPSYGAPQQFAGILKDNQLDKRNYAYEHAIAKPSTRLRNYSQYIKLVVIKIVQIIKVVVVPI